MAGVPDLGGELLDVARLLCDPDPAARLLRRRPVAALPPELRCPPILQRLDRCIMLARRRLSSIQFVTDSIIVDRSANCKEHL